MSAVYANLSTASVKNLNCAQTKKIAMLLTEKRVSLRTKVRYVSRHCAQKLQFNFTKSVFSYSKMRHTFLQMFFSLNCPLIAIDLKGRDTIIKIGLAHLLPKCRLKERSILLSRFTYLKSVFADGLALFMIATCYKAD